MTRKTFLIIYPDGSKKHVKRAERDELLLGCLITALNSNEYKYVGQIKTFHALSDLQVLRQQMIKCQRQEPDYYPGTFVVEYPRRLGQARRRESMQSAEALAIALPQIVARLNAA